MPLMTPLFPAIDAYKTGRLPVSGGHELYFERSGTPGAPAVVFVHGGPGSGAGARHRRYFNPAKWDMVLFDQRGCGRSTPRFSLIENTTTHLVEDLEALRQHLGLDAWRLFGPSWGSTLALAYTQAYPHRVIDLVVEGVLLGESREMDWFHNPLGAGAVHPDALWRLMGDAPSEEQSPRDFKVWALAEMQAELAKGRPYLSQLELPSTSLTTLRKSMIYRWSEYEETIGWLDKSPDDIREAFAFNGADWLTAHSLLEAWYFSHDCFLEPGQILARADRLTMPVHIIQSRYDLVCPGDSAHRLFRAAPQARLHWIERSGHVMTGPVHREVRSVFEMLAAQR